MSFTDQEILDGFKNLQEIIKAQKELNEVIVKRLNILEQEIKASTVNYRLPQN
tara:strand:+ start:50 stop:208 length:159 start_codon:yes stop_codon:yes gene_type:complete